MNRRGFLKGLIASSLSVAAVGGMPLSALITVHPELFYVHGDGIADDSAALHAYFNGQEVMFPDGRRKAELVNGVVTVFLPAGNYRIET